MFPVAMKKRAACIMATTPGPRNSYFMNLLALKNENNQPRLPLLRFGEPCITCMKGPEPWTCLHKLDDLPKWKDKSKQKELMYLYQGNKDVFLREQYAASLDESIRPFLPEYLMHLKTKELYSDTIPPECVFLAVDAAAGGKCEFAIVAGYFPRPHTLVIIYIDAFILKKASVDMERTRIQTACRLIQRHPRFKNVPIIHIPENAPGSAGPHLAEHLRTFHNVITMEECSTKGPYGSILGVPATDRVTQTYQMSMMLSTQAVYYSENCQTYPGQDLSKLKDKFEFQLLCWERVVEYDPSKPLSKVREKWMSKHAAGNDDLAVCGLMLCEWPERFFQNPKYADWIRTFITSSNKNTNNNIQKNPILDLGLPAFMGQNAKAGSIQTPYSRSKPPKQQSVEMNYQKPQNKIATPSYKPHNNQSLLSTKTPLQNRASISTTKTTTTTKTTAKLNNLLSIPKRNLIY